MNTIITKTSARIKLTHAELAIVEKALMEYYWHKDAEHAFPRKTIQCMLEDIRISRIVYRKDS